MRIKKTIASLLLFLFIFSLIPGKLFVFAKINCPKYKNTCPDENLIPQIKRSCGTSVLSSVYSTCEQEQKNVQRRMSELSGKKAEIEKKEGSAKWYLSNINYDIKGINAEIINAESSLDEIENELAKIDKILAGQRKVLSVTIRQVYEYDNSSYIEILLGNGSLSELSDKLAEVEKIERQLIASVKGITEIKEKLEKKRNEQANYKKVQEISRQNLAVRRDQQGYFLSQLKSAKTPIEQEMVRLNAEIKESQAAISRIQSYLSSWLGYRPSWSQIWIAVKNSSSQAGINKFTMLGILEVESSFRTNAGYNAGSKEGNLKRCLKNMVNDNHCYREKPVFEKICADNGLNSNKMPISYAYAMGPAQFIPTTWKGYEKYGPKNPWNLNDAVLAMAWKLKRGGGVAGYNPGGSSWYVPRVNNAASRWKEIYQSCNGFDLNCPNLRKYLEKKGIPMN